MYTLLYIHLSLAVKQISSTGLVVSCPAGSQWFVRSNPAKVYVCMVVNFLGWPLFPDLPAYKYRHYRQCGPLLLCQVQDTTFKERNSLKIVFYLSYIGIFLSILEDFK
jgi:hypothetical protein